MVKLVSVLAIVSVLSAVSFAEETTQAVKGLSAAEAGRVPLIGHTITVDKNVRDWVGTAPEEENAAAVNNSEYIWKDATGDDKGNGNYTYPLNKALKKGADLKEFRVTYDKDNLYLLVKTDRPADWWTGYRIIGIHKKGAVGGMTLLAQGDPDECSSDSGTYANLKVSPDLACQYVVVVSSTYKGRIWDEKGKLIGRKEAAPDDTAGFKIEDSNWNAIEIAIPWTLLGGNPAGQTWEFIVATGQQDNDMARPVKEQADEWNGGGGAANRANPYVYDLAGADKATQEKELGSYDGDADEDDPKGFATIDKSYLTVNFGLMR
jgi:hypothetical protein